MGPAQRGNRVRVWLLGLTTGLVAAGLAVLSLGVVTSSCLENSGCADRSDRVRYVGRLFTGDGRPLPGTFDLSLRSVQTHPVTAATDRLGRFCVVLPAEQETATLTPRHIVSALPVDPRFTGPAGKRRLLVARAGRSDEPQGARLPLLLLPSPLDAGLRATPNNASSAAWRPDQDQPTTCTDLGDPAPWYRYQGAWSSWQALTLLALPLIAWFLICYGLRFPPTPVLVRAGIAGLVVSVVLTLVLLDIPRGERYVASPPWLHDTARG